MSAGVRLHLVHQVIRVNSSAGFCMEGRNRPLGIRNATLLPKAPLWKECIKGLDRLVTFMKKYIPKDF